MKFILHGDGRGIDIQFRLSWRGVKGFAVAVATLVAIPEISRLVTLLGW